VATDATDEAEQGRVARGVALGDLTRHAKLLLAFAGSRRIDELDEGLDDRHGRRLACAVDDGVFGPRWRRIRQRKRQLVRSASVLAAQRD
jgi:hypothetical protein